MKIALILSLVFSMYLSAYAQVDIDMQYSRSSLCPILLTHPDREYSTEILCEYYDLDIPDKFDDHSVGIRSIKAKRKKTSPKKVLRSLNDNGVGRRIVAKWFGRDEITGNFNTDLLLERGLYNASKIDFDIARETLRGEILLSDVGDDLIGSTFVLVHDITYIKSFNVEKVVAGVSNVVKAMTNAVVDVTLASAELAMGRTINDKPYQDAVQAVFAFLDAPMSNAIFGFAVKTRSHLYQLEWSADILNTFYEHYWCDESTSEPIREQIKERFNNENDLFKLKYVGSYVSRSQKVGRKGLYSNGDMIRKVCARSLDNNTALLQKKHDPFKVSTPILSVSADNIIVPIGKKEQVDIMSKFEVLEVLQGDDGIITYKRVGVVRPVNSLIWDNRYMAVEEEAKGATLGGTTFRIVSGSNFYPGMLIREIR